MRSKYPSPHNSPPHSALDVHLTSVQGYARAIFIRPCLDFGMIDYAPRIDIGGSFQVQLMGFFFERHPSRKRLLDDPPARMIDPFGNLIDLFGEINRDMGSEDACGHIRNPS